MTLALGAELAAVRALTVAVMQSGFQSGRQLLARVLLQISSLRSLDRGLDLRDRVLVGLRNQQGHAILRLSAFLSGARGKGVDVGKTNATGSDLSSSSHCKNLLLIFNNVDVGILNAEI